jgi:acyl carrier protein
MVEPALVSELAEIVRSVALVPPEVEITAESRFVEDLGVDSFDMASIIFSVQDRYDIHVEGDDLPPLKTMTELAAYVAASRRSAAA